tara:strand:+ start:79 stop:315 length:237 start_codon:yes stop_codon:yes gene_type:complete
MPTYTLKNKATGKIFETDIIKYSTLEQMLGSDHNLELVPTAPKIIGSIGTVHGRHTDDGWKDTLKQIKKNNPGSNIKV